MFQKCFSSFFKIIAFLGFVHLINTNLFCPTERLSPSAAALKVILDFVDSSDSVPTQIDSPISKSIIIFSTDVNKDVSVSALTESEKSSLTAAANILRFGLFSGLSNLTTTSDSNLTTIATNLEMIISSLQVGTQYTDTFVGRLKKIQASLSIYQNTKKEKIPQLVQEKQILSSDELLGSGADGAGGWLSRLVNERMQANVSELKTDTGALVSADSDSEAPEYSWQSIRDILDKTKLVLSTPENLTQLKTTIAALNTILNSPITFESRIAALQAQINENNQFYIDSNYSMFKDVLKRAAKSLSSTVSAASRKEMFDLINQFVVKNNIDRTANQWISTALNYFSGNVLSVEVFKNNEIVALQLQSLTEENPIFLAKSQIVSKDTTLINIEPSKNGLVDALFFKVYLINDYVFFEAKLNNEYYYLCNYAKLATDAQVIYLSKSLQNNTSLSEFFNLSENKTKTNLENVINYFSKNDTSAPNDSYKKYAFKFYTAETVVEQFRNKVSLKNEFSGGYITACIDNVFRTTSPGDGQPFLLPNKTPNTFEQTTRSTFRLISQSKAVMALADGHRLNFNISDDGTVSVSDPTKCVAVFQKSLELTTPNDSVLYRLLLNEFLLFFNAVVNNEAGFDGIKVPATQKLIDSILVAYASATQDLFKEDSTMRSNLDKVQQKWIYIKSAEFINPLDANSLKILPKDSQKIVFQLDGTTKFLAFNVRKNVDGIPVYELIAKETTPLDPAAQFDVTVLKSIFGFKSLFAEGKYLTIKPETNVTLQDISDFKVSSLWSDENKVEAPFESSKNIDKQFSFIPVASTSTNLNFYLKNIDKFVYFPLLPANGTAITLHSTNKTNLKPIVLSAFVTSLSMASIEPDEAKKLQSYSDLIDNASTVDDIKFLLNDLNLFLKNKRIDFDSWNKFSTDSAKQALLKIFETKLESLFAAKGSSLSAVNDLRNKTKDLIQDEYAEKLQSLVLDNSMFALKWLDAQGKNYYFKLKDDNLSAGFSSNTIADPGVILVLKVSADNYIKISFKKLIDDKIASNAFFLKLSGNSFSLVTEENATEFAFEGPLNTLSLRPILRTNNIVSEQTGFVGTRNSVSPISVFNGVMVGTIEKPITGQQIFALEKVSDFELMLVDARGTCNLEDPSWTLKETDVWTTEEDKVLIKSLSERIGKYVSAIALMETKEINIDDKTQLIDEVKSFILDITSKIKGHAYSIILKDKQMRALVEQNILDSLEALLKSTSALNDSIAQIKQCWADGYLGASAFKKGDIVSIGVDGGFLSVVQATFNGQTVSMLKKTNSFLSKDGLFFVSSFKDKIGFSPISAPDKFISASLVAGQNKKIGWYSRVILNTPQKKTTKGEIDLAAIENNNFIFAYNDQTKKLTFNYKAENNLMEESILVIDNQDDDFLKGKINVESSTLLKDEFTLIERDPFHVRLTDAIFATTIPAALVIFTEILQQNYLNKSEDGDYFSQALVSFFEKQKLNDATWATFISDQSQRDSVTAFFVLVDKVNSSIMSNEKKATAKAAVSGDISADLTKFDGKYITLSWKDADSKIIMLQKINSGTQALVSWTSDDANTISSQFKVILNPGANANTVKLAFDGDSGAVKYLSFDPTENNPLLLLPENPQNISFKIFGVPGKNYLKTELNVNGQQTFSFLSIDMSSQDKFAKMLAGIDIGGEKKPSVLQVFNLNLISEFSRNLSQAKILTNNAEIISVFSNLAEMLGAQKDSINLSLLILELEKFVQKKTSDQALFNQMNNDKTAVVSFQNLLAQLKTLVQDKPELISKIDLMISSWKEGFMGAPPAKTPINDSVVIFNNTSGNSFLDVKNITFQGKAYKHLQFVGENQVELTVQFKVRTYKDKFGFESVSNPGFFMCATDILNVEAEDLKSSDNRIGLLELPKNKDGVLLPFGAIGTESYQFQLTSAPVVVGKPPISFLIKSRSQDSNLIADSNDESFLRTILTAKTSSTTPSAIVVNFIPVGALHSKLAQISLLPTDPEILSGFLQVLTEAFITNDSSADVFKAALLNYLDKKTVSLDAWNIFINDLNISKVLKQLLTEIGNNSFLKDDLNIIKTQLSRGFVQSINDGDFIIIKWVLSKDKFSILKATSEGTTIKLLASDSTLISPLTNESVLKVKIVNSEKSQCQLIYSKNDTDYYLQIQDTINPTTKVISRSVATFVPMSDDELKTPSPKLSKTLFEYQGAFSQFSLKSSFSRGFLSKGTDNLLTTISSGSPAKLAGVFVGSMLTPGQMEQFSIEILSSTSKELIDSTNPQAVDDLAPSITKFIEYPAFFQETTRTVLKSDSVEKGRFIDAVDRFVGNVGNNEILSNGITEDSDKLFLSLIQVLQSLDLLPEEVLRVNKILQSWIKGFGQAEKIGSPANGKMFSWFVLPEAQAPSLATTKNEAFSIYSRVVTAEVNKDNTINLSSVNFDEKLKNFSSLDEDLLFEQFILFNDPFAKNATFQMQVRRGNVVVAQGVESAMKLLKIDNTVNIPTKNIDANLWQQAAASFVENDVSNLPANNFSYFQLFTVPNQPNQFMLKNVLAQAYLSFNLKDCKARVFRKKVVNKVDSFELVSTAINNYEKFILVEQSDFHKQIFAARDAKEDDSIIDYYQKAIDFVKTQNDLDLCVEELSRFIILKKETKVSWDAFINKKDFVEKVKLLLQKFLDKFVKTSFNNLVVSNNDKKLIGNQLLYLSGKLTPRFIQTVEVEGQLLYFEDDFSNLKAQLDSLDESKVESFVQGLFDLFSRRTELDLTTSFITQGLNKDVVDWLSIDVIENQLVKNNPEKSKLVLTLINQFKNDFTFTEIMTNLSGMIQKIPGFSQDRFNLFMTQVQKASSIIALDRALIEGYSFDNFKNILKQGMANQLKQYLEKPIDSRLVIIPTTWNLTTPNYKQYLLKFMDMLNYPIKKGALFNDLISTWATKITAQTKETLNLDQINFFFNLISQWQESIGTALVYDDIKDGAFKAKSLDQSSKNTALSTAKKFYLANLASKTSAVIAKISGLEVNEIISKKFIEFRATLPVVQSVKNDTKSSITGVSGVQSPSTTSTTNVNLVVAGSVQSSTRPAFSSISNNLADQSSDSVSPAPIQQVDVQNNSTAPASSTPTDSSPAPAPAENNNAIVLG